MKRLFISQTNKEEKERNSNLWIEIENNGKLINSGWNGDYLVSTYIYNNKIYKLWNNMELGIMSEIEEYERKELKFFNINNKYLVAEEDLNRAENWLIYNHPDEYFSSHIAQVDEEENAIKNGDFSLIATKESYKHYNSELNDCELILKIKKSILERINK